MDQFGGPVGMMMPVGTIAPQGVQLGDPNPDINIADLASRIFAIQIASVPGRKPMWLVQFSRCNNAYDIRCILQRCQRPQLLELMVRPCTRIPAFLLPIQIVIQ